MYWVGKIINFTFCFTIAICNVCNFLPKAQPTLLLFAQAAWRNALSSRNFIGQPGKLSTIGIPPYGLFPVDVFILPHKHCLNIAEI